MKLLATVAALAFSSSAYATTIDFNDMVNDENYIVQSTYSSNGYDFVGSRADNLVFFGEAARELNFNADPTGTTLTTNYPGPNTGFTVTRNDGGLFDLVSFDYTDTFDDGISTNDIFLTLNFANAPSTRQLFHPDAFVGLQTLTLNATGLRSFTMDTPQTAQFDNFVVNAAASAVPEPAMWGMMILGFGVLGGAMRRRQTVRVSFA